MTLRGLYAITPDSADRGALLAKVREALAGGLAALQYRNKLAGAAQRRAEVAELLALCRDHGVPLIVNDDLDLAIESGADGAHLGKDDGELREARRALEGKWLGASCYDRLELAERAAEAGADYLAFGSVYPSSTKPGAVRAPLELFGRAKRFGLPLVAIGGITLDNAPLLLRAGADGLAVISDLFDAPDVAARARAYGALF